jgi:hypothetical protein
MPTRPRHAAAILALLCLVCAASPSAAKTVRVDLTGGDIIMSALDPFPFNDANVSLAADGFALTVDKFNANFQFAGTNPGLFLLPSGSIVNFTGGLPLDVTSSFTAFVSFDGVLYGAEGDVTLKLDPVTVAAQIVQPFSLSGRIDGDNLAGGKDTKFKLSGSGTMTAQFTFFEGIDRFSLTSASYRIGEQPESARFSLNSVLVVPEPPLWTVAACPMIALVVLMVRRGVGRTRGTKP